MDIKFFGGAGEVGRSCILISSGSTKILLDAGIKLGEHEEHPHELAEALGVLGDGAQLVPEGPFHRRHLLVDAAVVVHDRLAEAPVGVQQCVRGAGQGLGDLGEQLLDLLGRLRVHRGLGGCIV